LEGTLPVIWRRSNTSVKGGRGGEKEKNFIILGKKGGM